MIRLAFFIHFNRTWVGGINVILNLINLLNIKRKETKSKIKIVIFTNSKKKLKKYSINKNIEIIQDNTLFNQNIALRIIDKIFLVFFNKTIFLEKFLLKNKIDIISHTNIISGINSCSKSIIWIPDFQYLHFPKLFSLKYKIFKYINMKLYSKCAHKILLSSASARKDLKKVCDISNKKIRVNRFFFKVPKKNKLKKFSYLKKKYKLPNKYFYLPNQYWEHKNHRIVIEALKKIHDKKIFIYSTGSKNDYRNPKYFSSLMKKLKENKLENNYKYLGLVPYIDVMSLTYHSLALINPSYFEGWSSSVEQANAYKKIIILSKIKVHLEQNPDEAYFFNPNNSTSLKKILLNIYYKKIIIKNKIKKNTNIKINEYINNYCRIINL
tara:strand:- start:6428 stop:7573 length:1146 start_codon:yes stop_codon:yes gene_type:complete